MAKKILLLIGAAVLLAGAGIWAYSSSTTRNSETGAPAMMGCGGGKCGVVKDTPACAEAHASGQCEEGQEGCGGCGGGGCGAGGCGQGGCGQGGCGRTAQPQAGPAPARAETSCCPK